jgi:hypothetical protein
MNTIQVSTRHTIFITVMDVKDRWVIKNKADEGLTEDATLI